MPKEIFGKDYAFLPQSEVLTFEEIARLVRIFAGVGVQKVRLTGGEPLVRRDVEKLVALLSPIGDVVRRAPGERRPSGCSEQDATKGE